MPFLLVASLGFAGTVLPRSQNFGPEAVAMFGALVASGSFLALSIRRDVRTWVDPVGPLLFFGALVLARDLSGGSDSGLTALLVLPFLWLALHGTRGDLLMAAALTPLVFLGPIVIVGAPVYETDDWRRALGWTAFALFVAPVVQRVVQQLARETRRAREASAQMDGIMRGARLSSIISTDLDGTVRSFSVGAQELLGYRPEDVVGRRNLADFHDPDEVAEAAEPGLPAGFPVLASIARAAAPSRVWTYVRSDGSRVFVHLALTVLQNADGATVGYLGVAIDSTAAVEAEHALAHSEARWRVLLDHLPDTTVVMVDESRMVKVVAGAGVRVQGLRASEGMHLREFAADENAEIIGRLLDEAFAGQEATGEIVANTTGAEHVVVVTPLPPDGDEERALILARDVSADRARERALVRAKLRAERLFVDAPHGVAVLGPDGMVLHANDALLTLVDREIEDVQGQPLSTLAGAYDAALEARLERLLSTDSGAIEMEWTLRDARGEDVHVSLSARTLHGDSDSGDIVLVHLVDVSERRRYELRLAHLADHDALTGLANRRRFERELDAHLERCRRYGPTGALLLLDLDHFKEVNDTLGHAAGDQLIVSTAQVLLGGVREHDLVARLGGDEFAVLLTDADRAATETVAASIVTRIREHTATLGGNLRRVTASLGAVTVQAAVGHAADVLALADMMMYDAKEAGRNQYAVLEEDTSRPPRSGARFHWKARIERALEQGDFTLLLQPIRDLRTGTIHSAEALIRLQDRDEVVPPGRFLYIAERAGLVPAIDRWVVERAVGMLADLRVLDPGFQLEVNLSGLSIGHPGTEEAIVDTLHRHAVDPAALVLEITETAAVADVGLAREFAERMTGLGCKFALDDFGAGFGSFYYLKHLLFDYVKIDGEFVSHCHRSDVDRKILRSIVGIAHDLGKKTVAEFVSEPAMLEVVCEEGVDYAQGFLVGEPVSYDDFVARFLATTGAASGDPLTAPPVPPPSPGSPGRSGTSARH